MLIADSARLFHHAICMVSRVSPSSDQGYRMQLTAFCSTIVGGFLGGVLARPAQQWPSIFTGTIFQTYPYLLPNLFCTAVVLFGLVVGILFLEETHEDRKYDRDGGREAGQWIMRKIYGEEAPLDDKDATIDELTSMLQDHDHNAPAYQSTSSSPTLCSTRTSISEPPSFKLERDIQPAPTVRQAFTMQVCLNIVCYGILAL